MRTHLRAKGLVGTREGGLYLKIFFLFPMFNRKSDHFSPKIKPYIYKNRKSNAKPTASLIINMKAFDGL